MPKLNIVKIGGTIIEDKNKLLSFLKNFTGLKGPKILVHGGGKRATSWAKKTWDTRSNQRWSKSYK
jgi:acetylglutamate kinase